MTIQSINFGKIFNPQKAENKKTQSSPIGEKNEGKTTLGEVRNRISAKYLAALMGSATLLPAVTSCMQQETTVVVDTTQLAKMIADLIALNKTLVEQMDQNNKDNAEMIKQNKEIIAILNNVLSNTDDLKVGMDMAIELITQLISDTNKNDKEFLAKLDAILNSNLDANAKLDAILEENKQQNIKLALIRELIEEMKEQDRILSEKIEKWYNEYKENTENSDNAYSEMLQKIYEELINSNSINSETRDTLKALKEQLANHEITEAEYWAKVIELLGNIDSSLTEIKGDIKKLAADLPKYFESITTKQDESNEILTDIKNNTTDIKNSINEIKENQKIANENLIKIANNTDQINANLEIIKVQQGNMLTKEDLKEIFGPAYEGIMEMLGNISGNQISIEQLQELFEKNKTDLTKTNALIETLTTVVQNMNNGSESMAEVVKILNDMKNASGQDRAAIIAAFEKALEKLGKIEGSLDALLATANEIKADLKTAISGAEKHANKFYEELQKITSGISTNTSALERYAKQARESFLEAQKTQEKQTAILQSILEKEVDSGGNIDIDAIIAKLPNYTEILTQIKDAIGNLPNKDDMKDLIIKLTPDLTKTNALIETLTTVVQNLNTGGGDGSADMTETNRILGEVLDAVAKGQLDDSKNFDKYYELAKKAMDELLKISNNTKPGEKTKALKSFIADSKSFKQVKDAPKGWMVFNDSRDIRQKLQQIDMYKDINPVLAQRMEKELGLG